MSVGLCSFSPLCGQRMSVGLCAFIIGVHQFAGSPQRGKKIGGRNVGQLVDPNKCQKVPKIDSSDQHVGRRLRFFPLCGQLMLVSLCAFILGSPPILEKKVVDPKYKSAEADQHVGGPLRFSPLCVRPTSALLYLGSTPLCGQVMDPIREKAQRPTNMTCPHSGEKRRGCPQGGPPL